MSFPYLSLEIFQYKRSAIIMNYSSVYEQILKHENK